MGKSGQLGGNSKHTQKAALGEQKVVIATGGKNLFYILEREITTVRNVSQVCETNRYMGSASFNPNTSPDKRNSQIEGVTPCRRQCSNCTGWHHKAAG